MQLRPLVLTLIWLTYVAVMAVALYQHIPWRDEVDPWVFTRDATPAELLTNFRYAGHPPLWYVLILPFSRLGAPQYTLQLLQLIITSASAWLVIFRCPLPVWLRLPMLFSSILMYQIGVVARGYGLMSLVLWSVATLYPRRLEHPWRYALLLILLLNTEVHMLFLFASLSLFFLWDMMAKDIRLTRHIAIAFALASLLWIIIMWQTESVNAAALRPPDGWETASAALRIAYLPYEYAFHVLPHFLRTLPVPLRILPPIIVITLTACSLGFTRIGLLYIGQVAWLLYIFSCVYFGLHHAAQLVVANLFCLWLYATAPRTPPPLAQKPLYIILAALSLNMAYTTYKLCQYDKYAPYSGGRDMAKYLLEHDYATSPILYVGCHPVVTIGYYLPGVNLWQLTSDRHADYVLWDKKNYNACNHYDEAVTKRLLNSEVRLVLVDNLVAENHFNLPLPGATLLHESPGFRESFRLYLRPPQKPETP